MFDEIRSWFGKSTSEGTNPKAEPEQPAGKQSPLSYPKLDAFHADLRRQYEEITYNKIGGKYVQMGRGVYWWHRAVLVQMALRDALTGPEDKPVFLFTGATDVFPIEDKTLKLLEMVSEYRGITA